MCLLYHFEVSTRPVSPLPASPVPSLEELPVFPLNDPLTWRESNQMIQLQKMEIVFLKQKNEMLEEERDFLRKRLTEAFAGNHNMMMTKDKHEVSLPEKIYSDSSSDSESSSASSSEEEKKKKKCKAKKRSKKMRVKTPEESIRRYKDVLKEVQKGRSKAEAYSRFGIDRNTIVCQAPIAELAAANPTLYTTVRASFKKKESLKTFAETCRGFCLQEPTASAIENKKRSGTLLDIYRS